MRAAALIAAAFALVACQTPCPAPNTGPVQATYRCEDGSDLHVTFTSAPDSAEVAQEGFAPMSLPSRISGSSFRYAADGAELQRRGGVVRWTRRGAEETLCRRVG